MAEGVAKEYYESSKLAKFAFEPYWPDSKLRVCVTGAGGFIASHLAKRLKSEGHHVIGCDWKRNEHMPVRRKGLLTASLTCDARAFAATAARTQRALRRRFCMLARLRCFPNGSAAVAEPPCAHSACGRCFAIAAS